MTRIRPPLPARWEFNAAAAGLGLVALVSRLRRPGDAPQLEVNDPALRSWRARREVEHDQNQWWARLGVERDVLRLLTSVWLAWRSYQLERAQTTTDSPRARR